MTATLIGPGGRPISSGNGGGAARPDGADGGGPTSDYVKDANIQTFATDVLQASLQVPVIVDFWAPWCGPCKTLGPILERVVQQAKGAVRLVKVNIDENPEIAQQLRIQSIPTVYAFKNGQPVDGFMGAIPESQVRDFVAALTGGSAGASPVEDMLAVAEETLARRDLGTAAQMFGQILQEEPGNPKAVAGLAKCYVESGDLARARQTLGLVRPDAAGDEAIRAMEADLVLKEKAAAAGDMVELLAKLNADPADHQARYDLALALDAKGDRQAAIDELLEIVRRDRKWNDEAARKHLVTLFDAMGPADPRTLDARRKLSSILFS